MSNDSYQSLPLLHFAETIKKQHAKKRLQCLIFGNFGAHNLGDEAILAGELHELSKIQGLKTTIIAKYPKEIKRLHNTRAISFYNFSQIRKEIKKADFIIIGGGGLFNKKTTAIFGYTYEVFLLTHFLWAQRVYKKKIYTLGIGMYDNANFFIKKLAFALMMNSKLVSVRDQYSFEYLKKQNIHAHLCKDNSFLMDLQAPTKVLQDPYFKRFYNKDRLNIGFSLIKPASKKAENNLLTELLTFISKNYDRADFWFYASDYYPKNFNDEKFGHKLHELIKKKIGQNVQFHFIPTTWSPQLFFSSIKLMDYMITMRLHPAIFSYRQGCNFVGITQDKKCANFIKSTGKEVFLLPNLSWKKLQTNLH